MADRIDVEALLARTDLVAVVGSYVTLKKVGTEYAGLCPFHGEKTPSFYVVPNKGFCQCFGCGHNSDAIGFLQEIEGIDFKTACERLGADTTWKPSIIERPKPPTVERVTSKPPADAPMPDMEIRQLGKPARTWRYNDADGGLLGFVARYDQGENGSKRKEIRCWTFGRRGDGPEGWGCGHWSKPRHLYGLDRLAARPDAPVLITEGEKACDAAGELLPQYVAVAWPGGAQAWKHANFAPLRGRRVLLWPDADEPGIECMAAIARLLGDPRGLACQVKVVDVRDWSDGRDLADCLAEGWTLAQTVEWAKPRITYFGPHECGDCWEKFTTAAEIKAHVWAEHSRAPEAGQVPANSGVPAKAPVLPPPDRAEGPPQRPPERTEPEPAPVQPPAPDNAPEHASEPPAAEFPPEATVKRPGRGVVIPFRPPGPLFPPASQIEPDSGVLFRRVSEIQARGVNWLWPGRIAKGKFSVIVGNPGLGKSQITASLAAIVTVGGLWPVDRTPAELGNVIIMSAEDDAEDTIRPRLEAAGADLERVLLLQAVRPPDVETRRLPVERAPVRAFNLEEDIARLGAFMASIGNVALVIIDPISAYLGKADSHNNAEVRALLAPLADMAAKHGAAILAVSHLTKTQGMDALLRLQGSIAFAAAARAVWGVAKDKDNPHRRLFMPLKNNLGTDDSGFAYTVEGYTLEGTDPPITTSHVMWERDAVTQSAEEIFSAGGPQNYEEKNDLDDAKAFLRSLLADGPVPSKKVEMDARGAGHSWSTLKRAQKSVGVICERAGGVAGTGKWTWRLASPPPSYDSDR